MGRITAIEKQQDRDRVSVFVDGKYRFSLSLNQFADSKLKTGNEISNSQISHFKDLSDFGKKLERTIAWALRRPHSFKELDNYLYRKKIEGEDKEKIIEYITKRNYINDEDFVMFWIDSRSRSKKPSRRSLSAELRLKGISDDLINTSLEQAGFDEDAMLTELIEKKSRLSKYSDQRKLKNYLLRQGFSYDQINSHLSK